MKPYFLYFCILGFLSSCSVEQNYHFNKDMGGSYDLDINIADFINNLPDTSKNVFKSLIYNNDFATVSKDLNELSEFSNVHYLQNHEQLNFGFDFKDQYTWRVIENEIYTNEDISWLRIVKIREQKDDFLILDFSDFRALADTSDLNFNWMLHASEWRINFTFDRKISDVHTSIGEYNSKKNKLSYRFRVDDLRRTDDLKTIVRWETKKGS